MGRPFRIVWRRLRRPVGGMADLTSMLGIGLYLIGEETAKAAWRRLFDRK